MADTKFKVVLEMPFLKLSNADVSFGKGILVWKSYTINKAILITEQVQLDNLKEFVIAALDADSKTFVIHVSIWEREEMAIDPDRKAQIEVRSGVQSGAQSGAQSVVEVGALLFDKAPTEVPAE